MHRILATLLLAALLAWSLGRARGPVARPSWLRAVPPPGGRLEVQLAPGVVGSVQLERARLAASHPDQLGLVVEVRAEAEVSAARPPVNLVLALDRSGSMREGGRLPALRRAVLRVLDLLRPDDRLGVVTYSTQASVLVEPTLLGGAAGTRRARRALESLRAGGATHLSAGLEAAAALAGRHRDAASVTAVLLFSDGKANAGLTELYALRDLVTRRFQDPGIPLSVVGLGPEVDREVLGLLAQVGRGRADFTDEARDLEALFQQQLGTLEEAAATALTWSLRPAPGAWFPAFEVCGDNEAQLSFGALAPGQVERRRLELASTPGDPAASWPLLRASLSGVVPGPQGWSPRQVRGSLAVVRSDP